MMTTALATLLTVQTAVLIAALLGIWLPMKLAKAVRLCITLKDNEGAFVGLRTETHWDRWVFEEVKLVATVPNVPPQAVEGRVHVPRRNIAYYQELPNVVE